MDRVRAGRPDDAFTISLRASWDAKAMTPDEIDAQRQAYEEAGVQHVVAAPDRGDRDAWMAGMRTIAEALELSPR